MSYDAVVVGAGPNGLSAAVVLARRGLSVLVREAAETVGGSARTEELTLPGFRHDVCSSVYPLGVGSPFLGPLLRDRGLAWVHAAVPLAHPLDGGRAAVLHRSVDETARALGRDGRAYRRLVSPFVRSWPSFADHILTTPLRPPRNPVLMARFGLHALRSTTAVARRFATEEAGALLAGSAAHSAVPLESVPSAAVGLVLLVAGHAVGWPFARGGAGALTRALADEVERLGGVIETAAPVDSVAELPVARAMLLDLTPRQVLEVAGEELPEAYRRTLARWDYGPAAFKMDWALDAPIPWQAEACRRAGTVHVGGALEEIAESEAAVWRGRVSERPFVLVAQPSLFDSTRAPAGKHTAWAYCHVPNGWTGDASESIEAQVERFAPGFRERILERRVHPPAALEAANPNLVGGDLNGGAMYLAQVLRRPALSLDPWATPAERIYLCSASTPPGGGVHGMCGYHAACSALARTFRRT